jgi:guanine deaminase
VALGLVVATISGSLILPGLIDGQVHCPQARVLGVFGEHLLPWLEKWVIPEETEFKDRADARETAERFFDIRCSTHTAECAVRN